MNEFVFEQKLDTGQCICFVFEIHLKLLIYVDKIRLYLLSLNYLGTATLSDSNSRVVNMRQFH